MNISAPSGADLGRHLRLLLVEPAGESHTDYDEFRRRLAMDPELDIYTERLVRSPSLLDMESSLAMARYHEVDAVLVWAESTASPPGAKEMSAPAMPAPLLGMVIDVAERVNLFDHCFIALVGMGVSRQEARRLGFEDGFAAAMPLEEVIPRLLREAVARARNPGSSPPCYL